MNKKNLLAWYQFDDEENIGKDSSDRGMDAVACGTIAPSFEVIEGKKAVILAGGDHGTSYLKLPENVLEGVSDDTGLTISTWVYCNEASSPWERIFDFGQGEQGPYVFLTRLMRAVCFKNEDIPADAGSGILEKKWVHIALTISGTYNGALSSAGPKLYINGELCANGMISQTSSGNYKAYREWFATFSDSLYQKNYIGHSQYAADPDFGGAFSDFRIYQECLSENDIIDLMCMTLDKKEILILAKEKYLQAPNKIITEDLKLPQSLMGGKVDVKWSVEPASIIGEDGKVADVVCPTKVTISAKMKYEEAEEKKSFEATVMPKDMPAYELTVKGNEKVLDISDTLYGLFYEDINHAADGGIYAQMIQNFSFENFTFENYNPTSGICGATKGRKYDPLKYWFGDLDKVTFCQKDEASYSNYVEVKAGTVLYNRGFCDENMCCSMNLVEGESYQFSMWMKSMKASSVKITLLDAEGEEVSNSICLVSSSNNTWAKHFAEKLVVRRSCLGQIRLEFTEDTAIDFVELFPENVWGASEEAVSSAHANYLGNPNYRLRKDLVLALRELYPKFLRFPGGCISEGSYIWDNVYDWKDSVGPIEKRVENFNVWGYNMTLGLGYMEYFQLAEDLGATPLPVMACGVLCQARSDYAAPAGGDLREKYIKNFTDLIDFAISTDFEKNEWARLRRDMGHAAPFDLHYLGVGNENWGTEFYANFEVFYQRIDEYMKKNYPGYELHIISTAGAQADDTSYQLGWKYLAGMWPQDEVVPFTDGKKSWEEKVSFYEYKKDYMNTIVDEHYYRSNEYLLENADRYNYYYRADEDHTSKVFVGEYASSDKNTLAGAVAEAAVMTGFENNSDVVRLAATAPLFNKVGTDGTYRWTPDVIWFDDTTVWRTPNYYVQQMFAKYIGHTLLQTEFETYEKGARVKRIPRGGVSVRKMGDVEFEKLTVTSNETGKVLIMQENGHKVPEMIRKLADGYYICQPDWSNYKVELEINVLSSGACVAVGTGILDAGTDFDESKAYMHEYVVGHKENGTGLRVLKEGKEGYKMGDYSSSVYAGNFRKCYDDVLEEGRYVITVDFGGRNGKELRCSYGKLGKKPINEQCFKLENYNYELYNSVTEDDEKVYIKLVNAHGYNKKCALRIEDIALQMEGTLVTLTGDHSVVNLPNINRKNAEVIVPDETRISVSNNMILDLPSDSVNVLILEKCK